MVVKIMTVSVNRSESYRLGVLSFFMFNLKLILIIHKKEA